jgi:CheY-like chemotaxis protein
VLGFAKQSNGGVRIDTVENKGTSIHIFVPRSKLAQQTGRDPVQGHAANPGLQARILLVDDDDAVRQVTADMLGDLDYQVVDVGSAGAAFDALDSQDIDLLLLDFAMPGMSGAEIARRVRTRYPKLPIVFVTGYADLAQLEGVNQSQTIGKPFEIHELAKTVADALTNGRASMVREGKRSAM